MKLARTLQLDGSDQQVFERPAKSGEWAVPGGFAFSNWTEDELTGKARQAFANGWLGLESFGRATLVVVTDLTQAEYEAQVEALAEHFVEAWGAPSVEAARPVAEEELSMMREMCEDHPDNTLLAIERALTEGGVRERFRAIAAQDAELESFAVHGSLD